MNKVLQKISILACLLPGVLAISSSWSAAGKTQEASSPADIGKTEVQVRGRLVDVRTVQKKGTFFPQYEDSKFDDYLISKLGEGREYAVSLAEYRGPEQVRCGALEHCLIALDADVNLEKPWVATGEEFEIMGIHYYMYEFRKVKTGEWIDIPYPQQCRYSVVVFGTHVSVSGTPEWGTLIAKVPEIREYSAYNQAFTILPDGSYLAACTGTTPDRGVAMYRSTDKGLTWERYGNFKTSKHQVANYCNLFVHRGSVYICGTGPDREGLRLCRSDDGGLTWTAAKDSRSGIIAQGKFHTAPVPVVVCNGRIWRACETYPDKTPFMISAPEDSDLLDASSWIMTNTVGHGSRLIEGNKMSGSIIEGNAVVSPEGKVVNLIRTNSTKTSAYATILHTEGIDSLYFDPLTDWVRMPGGGKKFTVRFDPVSGMYWALTNPDSEQEFNHIGLGYKVGISHSLMRNKLVLLYSPDLHQWTEVKTLMYDPDPFFHGFQYADWMFEGEDIVGVVRVGAPESRGLPVRQHDSNMMTFIRVDNFRQYIK
ncbi:MAG: glycoside hydrolase [Bacteroidales bacterium]|nr:glycoside hydrolase [Bacteroidales bacterium]